MSAVMMRAWLSITPFCNPPLTHFHHFSHSTAYGGSYDVCMALLVNNVNYGAVDKNQRSATDIAKFKGDATPHHRYSRHSSIHHTTAHLDTLYHNTPYLNILHHNITHDTTPQIHHDTRLTLRY